LAHPNILQAIFTPVSETGEIQSCSNRSQCNAAGRAIGGVLIVGICHRTGSTNIELGNWSVVIERCES
jgi:hypothetical protein